MRFKNKHSIIAATLIVLLGTACQRETQDEQVTTTPYAIGSKTLFIHDDTRPYDSVAGVNTGIRTLLTEIWYPVSHETVADNTFPRATYGDYVFGDQSVHHLMMTKTTFFHLTPETVREGVSKSQIETAIDELFYRERQSFVDAPPAEDTDPWPVIVMSHGDAGSRYNMETVCEYLAAHGYFVIAPEHTGNSPYSLTGRDPALEETSEFQQKMASVLERLSDRGTYGEEQQFGQSYTPLSDGTNPNFLHNLDASLVQRVNDLRATLNELKLMNQAGPFAGRLDLRRIGLMGRSFGGVTTLAGLGLESRFLSGIAVVPPAFADTRKFLPPEALKDHESVILSRDGSYPLGEVTKPTLLLSGAEDGLIIRLSDSNSKTLGATAPTPDNPHPMLFQMFQTTDAPVVWGLLKDSNHGSFGVSGPYWWPELKPNTQKRHFEPDTDFTLVKSDVAHLIQKQKALHFFDWTLKKDQRAKSNLKANEFESEGLIWETRNF
ncbi:MAG: acetylhydrolase [Pseudomonadota bacterium]